jgi:phytoene synthase
MSATDVREDAERFCADLVRSQDFARYASTLFVPAAQRRALLAIYAFNAEITRVREQISQPLPGEIRMQWWTDMLAGAGNGGVEGNPVAAELLQAIRNFRLPVEPLSRLRWRRWKAISTTLRRRCLYSPRKLPRRRRRRAIISRATPASLWGWCR